MKTIILIAIAAITTYTAKSQCCPSGLAGRLQADYHVPSCNQYFYWEAYYPYPKSMGNNDTAVLCLAFKMGGFTAFNIRLLGSDPTFFDNIVVWFQDGLVNGKVPYSVDDWNQVTIRAFYGPDSYVIEVNGLSKSFGFGSGEAVEDIQAFALMGAMNGGACSDPLVAAWVDEISLSLHQSSGVTELLSYNFDDTYLPSAPPAGCGCGTYNFGTWNSATPPPATLPPGCSAKTSGLPDSASGELTVFPNPSTDHVMISLPGDTEWTVQLLDATGSLLRTERHTGAFTWDVSTLPKGIYLVYAGAPGEHSAIRKLVVD